MPTSTLPGVYWQDVFPTRRAGLLTGVPAFLGICPKREDGTLAYDTHKPQSLHLWPQFVERFGATTPGSFMADAVQGFFENGGRDCVVCWLENDSETALEQGLAAVEAIDSVDLICAPDVANRARRTTLQALILRHCAEAGNRFAILDTPNVSDLPDRLQAIRAAGRSLKGLPGSDYGALYGPWLTTLDGKRAPPCGHVAGVYAASDRADVPRAPANIALAGVVDVALSSEQQTQLAQIDDLPINGIRSLRGRGVRIWGARTLSSDPQWRYVTVRRLAITIHRWVVLNLAEVAFEPNGFRLWLRIERELNAYLESLWQRGYLQGRTAAEAFRVRCDAETNPPVVRDQGQVITHIELAPSVPNEFIQVRLIHGETGVALATSP